MDTTEKINLWLKMGKTLGVPQKQLQAVRTKKQKLFDGEYRGSWTEKFCSDSAVEAEEGQTSSINYSGAALLRGLQAGLERCYEPTRAGATADVTEQAETQTSGTEEEKTMNMNMVKLPEVVGAPAGMVEATVTAKDGKRATLVTEGGKEILVTKAEVGELWSDVTVGAVLFINPINFVGE